MLRKKTMLLAIMVMTLSFLSIAPARASATGKLKQTERERLTLIQASQEMVKEESSYPKARFAMYAVGLDPEYEEINLGARFELSLLPTNLRIAIEGVELERGKPVVGFLSLMLASFYRTISPYIGIGAGVIGEKGNKKYQLFAGAEIGNSFFLEVRYVNQKKINTTIADIYSVAGFKISF